MTIEKIVAGGSGLARVDGVRDGEAVLVPRTAPGDVVAVEIDRSRRPARGRLLKVLTPSPHRVAARCPVVDRCGGCDLMHLDVEGQRTAREAMVREALPAAMRELPIAHHAATPDRGRTRARFHARKTAKSVMLGYRQSASATIVDLEACCVLDPRIEAALHDARAMLVDATGEGEVHAAIGRDGRAVLAVEWKGELSGATFAEAERRVNEGRLAGVEIVMEGARAPATVGDPRAVSTASDGLSMIAPSRGFAQASDAGDRVLVDLVVQRSQPKNRQIVELFAGSGNFTVPLAREAAHVTAIEIVEPATRAMRENLEARGLLSKVKIVVADADATPIARGVDLVVLDPPRAGAAAAVRAIAESRAKRVVYVSCDPSTLGRDLAVLLAARYVVDSIDLVDLFPETSHVETVVVLRYEKPGK